MTVRRPVWLLLLSLLVPGACGAAPSWFVYRNAGVEVHVCNVVENKRTGQQVNLSVFAPRAGAAWARETGAGDCYLLPVKTVGVALDSRAVLWVQVARHRYASSGWPLIPALADTMYAIAVVPRRFALKDVTGFELETDRVRRALRQESKLR